MSESGLRLQSGRIAVEVCSRLQLKREKATQGDLFSFLFIASVNDAGELASTRSSFTSFVNNEAASADFLVVESVDSVHSSALVAHFHEAKTASAAGFTVSD